MFFCFICDQSRKVKSTKPAAGACGNCQGPVAEIDTQDTCRFCFIPLCWKTHRMLVCRNCGSRFKANKFL